jgi:hypothetical protein
MSNKKTIPLHFIVMAFQSGAVVEFKNNKNKKWKMKESLVEDLFTTSSAYRIADKCDGDIRLDELLEAAEWDIDNLEMFVANKWTDIQLCRGFDIDTFIYQIVRKGDYHLLRLKKRERLMNFDEVRILPSSVVFYHTCSRHTVRIANANITELTSNDKVSVIVNGLPIEEFDGFKVNGDETMHPLTVTE